LPELPDVEVFRRYFSRTALHKSIMGVEIHDAGVLRGISGRQFRRRLKGHSLESTRRRGKHMLACLDNHRWLSFHFGMTGYPEYFKSSRHLRRYDRVVLDFANGYHLAFVCPRKLGRLGLIRDPDRFFAAHSLGPDALDLDLEAFEGLMRGRRGAIKPALMDQSLIAGIGNIYADEMLYQAGVHPLAMVQNLRDTDIRSLFRGMKRILEMAIERRADLDDLPRTWLSPHRKEGAVCPRCRSKVKKLRIANRSSYYCPACQSKR
jgi:formamidopyrimidine-DNA glycosylase